MTQDNKNIRVLQVVSSLNINAGVMAVIMNYYRFIDRNKIQFDFLYFTPMDRKDTYQDEIEQYGGNCYLIDKPGLHKGTVSSIENVLKKGYDIVHNHEAFLSFLFEPIAKKNSVKAYCVHAHSTKFADKPLNTIRNFMLCLPNRFLVDYKFACSEMAAETYYGKKVVRDGDYILLHNAINMENYRFDPQVRKEYREALGISEDTFVIGSVGRLCPQKNFSFLIKVFKYVHEKRPETKLVIAGAGGLEEELKHLTCDLQLENAVRFLGRRPDVNKLYNVFDLFVLPSLYEGLCVVLVEVQCNGLTCVTSDAISIETKILDSYSSLSLNRSEAEWADYIINKAMKIKRTAQPDTYMIKSGYDITKEAGKLLKVYQKMLSN